MFLVEKSDAYQDENGMWRSACESGIRCIGRCRWQSDGRGTLYHQTDGTTITISGVVYTVDFQRRYFDGKRILVARDENGSDVICERNVISANYGFRNTTIYLD